MTSGEIPIPRWLDQRRWIGLVGAVIGMVGVLAAILYGDEPGSEPSRDELVVEDGRQFIERTGGENQPWVVPVLVGGVVLFAFGITIGTTKRPLPGSAQERRTKVDKLSESLKEALRIIEQITSEVEDGEALVARLERDAETKRLLAGLQDEQARAVLEEMRATVRVETNRGTWFQFLMGLGFFIAGVLVTLALT